MLSNNGDRNIVDSVDYIVSGIWKDGDGKDKVGVVMTQEEQIFTAREVQEGDDRPGGYVTTGGHGGIVGSINPIALTFVPTKKHTYSSDVNLTRLPARVNGLRRVDGRISTIDVSIKNDRGDLLPSAIPKVTIVKYARYLPDDHSDDATRVVEVLSRIDKNLQDSGLSGFVLEGNAPYSNGDEGDDGCPPAHGPSRHAHRPSRSRESRGGHTWKPKRPFHRGKQPDGHKGSPSIDGMPHEVRQPAGTIGPRASDRAGARCDPGEYRVVSNVFDSH